MGLVRLLFGFGGRINRGKYWLWVLLYSVAALLVWFMIARAESDTIATILQIAFTVVASVSALAVTIKRLHDRNRSAWWALVFVVAPPFLMIGGMFMVAASRLYGGPDDAIPILIGGLAALGVGALLLIWGLIELACLRGTVGANPYGPDPLGGA